MIDESRSQTNDTSVSILYPDEIDSDTICTYLKKNKIGSEIMPSKSIKAEFGLAHKVWIYLDYEQKKYLSKLKFLSRILPSMTR
jgi:hypothetical protein